MHLFTLATAAFLLATCTLALPASPSSALQFPDVLPTQPAYGAPRTDPSIKTIRVTDAAIPGSPISQAVISGNHIYISGFLPLAPHTGALIGEGDVVAQTLAILNNINIIIEATGSHLGKVVKVTLYLKNVEDYGVVNEVYATFFGTHRPARSAVAVADIPLGVLVQIDAIVRI
ncbi:2-iminobutanoate/2-iminopropanoate deaminase [Hypsizygus marmoreus]|uniref:2-iminobutanoate/2-iminopropanoate deaminase n=1 Tax=Hypsizygus marmoreus TaxID=39966 RepID=A0A369JAA4_HYPMA|nr:2-iminobutanoate/2-iminopropanoate deaminase [Hypsizygus marmoreus]